MIISLQSADTLHRALHEQLYVGKPAIKHVHPFSITGFVHIPVEARRLGAKLLDRAKQGLFVGHGWNTKTSRNYIQSRSVIAESRNFRLPSLERFNEPPKLNVSMET
jgi:hypothetical protein